MPYGLQGTVLPPAVTRWTNVIDEGDTLALGHGMEFAGAEVRDVWLDCDPRLRSPRNYLASPEFGDVLAAQLPFAV
jgi:hypothetical protein